MRRAIVTGTATVSGVVLLLGLKPHSNTPLADKGASNNFTANQSDASESPPDASESPQPSSGSTKTVTGDAADTRYGPVQVAVTFSGKKITQIQVVQYPTETGRDQEINDYAIPQLNQQAMSAQSAKIDGVSGATYTSEGYQQSLQSAIDKAGA
jgi:uncharacterized protein with FMN-binding domain